MWYSTQASPQSITLRNNYQYYSKNALKVNRDLIYMYWTHLTGHLLWWKSSMFMVLLCFSFFFYNASFEEDERFWSLFFYSELAKGENHLFFSQVSLNLEMTLIYSSIFFSLKWSWNGKANKVAAFTMINFVCYIINFLIFVELINIIFFPSSLKNYRIQQPLLVQTIVWLPMDTSWSTMAPPPVNYLSAF